MMHWCGFFLAALEVGQAKLVRANTDYRCTVFLEEVHTAFAKLN